MRSRAWMFCSARFSALLPPSACDRRICNLQIGMRACACGCMPAVLSIKIVSNDTDPKCGVQYRASRVVPCRSWPLCSIVHCRHGMAWHGMVTRKAGQWPVMTAKSAAMALTTLSMFTSR